MKKEYSCENADDYYETDSAPFILNNHSTGSISWLSNRTGTRFRYAVVLRSWPLATSPPLPLPLPSACMQPCDVQSDSGVRAFFASTHALFMASLLLGRI